MVTSANMEQPSSVGSRQFSDTEINLKEWALKGRISRENSLSRRYSASYIRSFREEARSFRSNVTISSTASSPCYALRDEIDPSTYSFTNALKALQAKTIYSWEYMSPDGLALNSKWSDAERYICNPLSGEVPLECLSAKSLTGNSFPKITRRITMSAPLIYPAYPPHHIYQMNPPFTTLEGDEVKTTIQDNKIRSMIRDVGIQSTPVDVSSNSLTPVRTPSIEERSIKRNDAESGDSQISRAKDFFEEEVEMKVTSEEEDTKRNEGDKKKKKSKQQICCMCSQAGCLPPWTLWTKTRQRLIHKSRENSCVD